jgi:transposase
MDRRFGKDHLTMKTRKQRPLPGADLVLGKEAINKQATPSARPKKVRRTFDEQFRRDAVALLESTGEPLSKVAAQLGVTHWNLRDWIKRYGRRSGEPSSPVANLRQVIVRLQQENDTLKAERDILKKAMGILTPARPTATRS